MTRLQTRFTYLFFGLLFLILIQFNRNQWNQLPNGMHTWTQSDHFELTNGFVANNLDFFHPQTKIYAVYNQDFPSNWKTVDSTTITSVDFPIHQYIPAVMMKLFHSQSPIFSQLYMFLLGCIGLIFIFRLAFLSNSSVFVSAFITCFVCFSPVYTFYSIRFIPSIPSFSLAVIGMYYYFKYRKNEQVSKYIIIGISFLTLAALGRMTFLIPLLCVLGLEFIRLLKLKNNCRLKWSLGSTSIAVFIGYFSYNSILKEKYGTLFLTALNPAKSFSEFKEIIQLTLENWKWEYITGYHYVGVALLLILVVVSFFQNSKPDSAPVVNRFEKTICALLLLGSLVFFSAMSAQFVHHDYYFVDSCLLFLTIFMCVFSLYLVPKQLYLRTIVHAALVFIVIGMAFSNKAVQNKRADLEKWGEYATIANDFSDSKQLLNKLGIPNSNKLLLLMSTAPNYALHFMDRNAYVSLKNDPKRLKRLFQFKFDYVVFQNEWFMREVYATNPMVIQHLKTVGTNGKITVCKLQDVPNQTIYSLFNLNKRPSIASASMGKETAVAFKNVGINSVLKDSIWEFNIEIAFGPMLNITSAALFQKNRFLVVEGESRSSFNDQIALVVSKQENKEITQYQSFPIDLENPLEWKKFRFFVTIPPAKQSEVDFATYIYNPKHIPFSIRNLSMKVF